MFSLSDLSDVFFCGPHPHPHHYHPCRFRKVTEPVSGRLVDVRFPSPAESFEVPVVQMRLYSRVSIQDHNSELWPGEILRAQADGMFRVRDPIHGDYPFPVGRGDLTRIGDAKDGAVGYLWFGYGEEEDEEERVPLYREDLEVGRGARKSGVGEIGIRRTVQNK
jgi:hypothetical protein